MKIAIVGGTKGLGLGLALRFAAAGEEVWIGSRSADRGEAAAAECNGRLGGNTVGGGANADVVKGAGAVFVTVPFPGHADTYKQLKEVLEPGTTVVDCNVPLASEIGGKPTRLLGVWEGSAAQAAKGILGRAYPMAAGFHTIMAGALADLSQPLHGDVLVCGESDAKEVTKSLVLKITGARYVDCGALEMARILESLTALLIGINGRYKLDPGAGITISNLPG
jgi:8-hydroxy-5-deazaflavin:NADPH oxidoreductase